VSNASVLMGTTTRLSDLLVDNLGLMVSLDGMLLCILSKGLTCLS